MCGYRRPVDPGGLKYGRPRGHGSGPALVGGGLFVLAPAYYMEGYEDLTPPPPDMPICIVHGWRDDIVPVDNSIRFARQCRATLHLVDGDHRLTANIDDINTQLEEFINKITGKAR